MPFEDSRITEVIIDGHRIRIKIEEKAKFTGKILDNSLARDTYVRQYAPGEQLSLVITNYSYGYPLRKVWRDGKRKKVEEKLGEFIAGIFDFVAFEKQKELRSETRRLTEENQRKERRLAATSRIFVGPFEERVVL